MARVADYVIISDASVVDGTTNTIKFTVPDNIDTGLRCVLSFMFEVFCDATLTLRISINGIDVWTWSASGVIHRSLRCMQEVVSADIVKAGENLFQFDTTSSGLRFTALSDIVLWFQGSA